MLPDDWIDCHFHVFHQPSSSSPDLRYTPSYGSSLADWEAATPSRLPRRGVLVQTSFLGIDNGQLLAELRQRPETLRGVAVIDPLTNTAELQALHWAGVRGIRLNLVGATARELDAVRLPDRLTGDLLALGWNVELHTDAGLLPAVLGRIDPRLVVVLDHFGKPGGLRDDDATFRAVDARLDAGSAAVHVKLSGAYRLGGLDPRVLAQRWRDRLGSRRLLWGSDWPCTNHEDRADYAALLDALSDWLDDPAERRQVLIDNPLDLYWP